MAKRKTKPALPALADWRAVDKAVMALAGLQNQAARLKAEAEEKIRVLREDAAARAAEALGGAAAFHDAIEAFADDHAEEFGKARSLALPHGRIGWRTVTSIRLARSAEFVVAALEAADLKDAVITRKSPNKDVLAAYSDDVLREVGARRKQEDRFYVEPKDETPAQALRHSGT